MRRQVRPLTLELEGFTAFRSRTIVDFSQLDLFAITGPTGAGKSSLIDAISYALYGRVPRVSNEVSACISQGIDRMQVSLTFRAGALDYRVFREARRKGAGNVRLEKMGTSDWEPLADRSREVNEKVERIVGLDFDGFTRSVLLPQGQFQEFLAGAPDKRREVLKRLLRLEVYERTRQRAASEASSKKARVEEIERWLRDELADATPETLAARERELEEAEKASERLGNEIDALDEGQKLLIALNQARSAQARARDELEAASKGLAEAEKTASEGAGKLASLRKEHDAVKTALDANTFDDQLFAALTAGVNVALDLRKAERQQVQHQKELDQAASEGERLQATVTAASQDEENASKALEQARAAYEEAQRHDLAAALQAGLQPGDDCPVCGGKVGKLPAAGPGRVDDARRALTAAEERSKKAAKAAQEARTAAATLVVRLDGLQRDLQGLDDRVRELAARMAETLPQMKHTSLETLQKAIEDQKAQRERRQKLTADEAALSAGISKLEAELAGAQARLDSLKSRVEAAEKALETATEAVRAALSSAVGAAEKNAWEEALTALRQGGDALPRVKAALEGARSEQQRVLIREGQLREQVTQIERDIAKAGELRKELAGLKSEHDVAADLAQMLQANRFQAYLQSEALQSLADAGSRRLLELSNGRYELAVAAGGQDFEVIDKWNADDARSVRTLSGGETFLASLALSLALAESLPSLVPDRRVALDSIFLDEGFGTLDPEALLLSREALEALSLGERFVCVVTHLPELAESLPARLIVNKSQAGSTVAID
jgi:DNA repair protein SbcC/Rad50